MTTKTGEGYKWRKQLERRGKRKPMQKPRVTDEEIIRAMAARNGRRCKGKTSPAKRAAARANGRKGGRPKKSQLELRGMA